MLSACIRHDHTECVSVRSHIQTHLHTGQHMLTHILRDTYIHVHVATGLGHPDIQVIWVTFCPGQSGFHLDILICLTRIKSI